MTDARGRDLEQSVLLQAPSPFDPGALTHRQIARDIEARLGPALHSDVQTLEFLHCPIKTTRSRERAAI